MAFGSGRSEAHDSTSGKQAPRGDAALTIVASGTTFVGDLESDGVVKIEGEIAGTVRAERQVLVARGGVVRGDIITNDAVLGGEVHGGVTATGRVEVQPGAAVHGDIARGGHAIGAHRVHPRRQPAVLGLEHAGNGLAKRDPARSKNAEIDSLCHGSVLFQSWGVPAGSNLFARPSNGKPARALA